MRHEYTYAYRVHSLDKHMHRGRSVYTSEGDALHAGRTHLTSIKKNVEKESGAGAGDDIIFSVLVRHGGEDSDWKMHRDHVSHT